MRLTRFGIPKGNQRPMPHKGETPGLHRRIEEAVAERAAFLHRLYGAADRVAIGGGTMEHALECARPDLRISSHGLAVQPDIVRVSAEKDRMDMVFSRELGGVIAAQDALPAMAAPKAALKFPQALVVGCRIMPRPVQPARLRNPDAGFLLVTGDGLQQQYL